MGSRKNYHENASTYHFCSLCKSRKCCCQKKSLIDCCKFCSYKNCRCKPLCKCIPKCKGKCEFELLNIDASKDVTVTQGDLDLQLEQGDVSQNNSQGQSGSNLGPQNQTNSQGQSGSSLGSQTQTPTETQNLSTGDQSQTGASQTQSGSHSQTQSPSQTGATQTQTHTNGAQSTGPQTLQANPTNNSSADVTQTVSGVTVNVPVTLSVSCGCDKKKHSDHSYKKEDCCAKAMGDLLNQVRTIQPTFLETINIYLTDSPALATNPILNQTVTGVNNCATVSFAPGPIVSTPSTTAQLCKVAGFSVIDNGATPNLFQFVTNYAATCSSNLSTGGCGCGKNDCYKCNNSGCKCNACAAGIGEQLRLLIGTTNVDLVIDGVPDMITNVRVLNICDCLAFFVDDTNGIVYAFTLCAVNEFTPLTSPVTSPPGAPPADPTTFVPTSLFDVICKDDKKCY